MQTHPAAVAALWLNLLLLLVSTARKWPGYTSLRALSPETPSRKGADPSAALPQARERRCEERG